MVPRLRHVTELSFEYGRVDRLSPLVRRVIAENPSKFTFTGTGTYLIGHGDGVGIVDPGPVLPAHVDALLAATEGERITHLLITHTHGDHSPAVRLLRERGVTAPTYGFGPHPVARAVEEAAATEGPRQEESSDHDFVPDVRVGHGDIIDTAHWSVRALHTPGHISNHLCFALRNERAVFTGDHVMGWSTTVVPPPDGDMRAYLASLRLLLERDDRVYYPTHGPPVTRPRRYVEALLEHRLGRERQIIAQLALGPRTIAEIVAVLYADVREELHPVAARSVQSHLAVLEADGRAGHDGDDPATAIWSLR